MLKPPKIHRQCHSQISHIGNIKTAFNVQADVKNEPRLPPCSSSEDSSSTSEPCLPVSSSLLVSLVASPLGSPPVANIDKPCICAFRNAFWITCSFMPEENLLDFVRFMGVMSSCNNPAVNYWFHKTIGNFKPYYPWNAPPNENPYHARRGIKDHVIQNAFRKAQLQGLSMLATGGEPRGDATSETSSDEDTGRQGSDVELESSDDELPYIDPNMEPVQQRPVMFVSRVPAKKPRKLPWPTPKTHPVKRTNVKTSDRSDKAEAQSTPERPGPSEQSSVTVERRCLEFVPHWLPSRSTRRVVCLTHYRVSGLIALAGAIAKINGNMGHTWEAYSP